MAVQSEIFSTEYGVRSFISTKHIATKQHMSVWLQRRSDNIWVQLSTSNYELINNSAVLTQAPNSITYSKVEIRVADTPDELGSSQSEIAVLAGLYDEIVALNGIKNDITTVAGISGDVTTVSSNILDINSVATNIVPNLAEILQADTNATIATTKATEASASATSASNSAITATNQATIATTKASEASASASSASNSATTAITKESEANASAISASNSATSASNSATTSTTKANEASASASLASASANNASTSETMAYKWSSNPVDTIVETDKYSAFHWATKAQQYASSVDPSNLVHKNGDETITGFKTFSSSPIVPTPINSSDAVNKEYVDLKISTNQIFDKPSRGSLFIKVSPSSIKIPVGLKLTVGTESFKLSTDYTLSLNTNLIGSTKTAGTDYYIYAKSDATFYISASDSITTDRLVGGFHYGLVGESEAATGNKTEDNMVKIRGINQYSFWDLKYRPVASTKGMVNIGNRWYDIYLLNSEHIANGTSKAGLTIAGGVADANGRAIPKIPLEYGGNGTITYGKFTWFQACEIGKAHNKEMISYAEFPTIAYGVNEQKSSQTNAYEVVAGKIEHYPNLTSKYGIEQATGVQCIWCSNLANYPTDTTWAWRDKTDSRGQIYYTENSPTAVLLGGNRGDGVHVGSRASAWNSWVWDSSWDFGCRFACYHLELE